jgi:hypothetical protein
MNYTDTPEENPFLEEKTPYSPILIEATASFFTPAREFYVVVKYHPFDKNYSLTIKRGSRHAIEAFHIDLSKIKTVIFVRGMAGISLKEAKEAIDKLTA